MTMASALIGISSMHDDLADLSPVYRKKTLKVRGQFQDFISAYSGAHDCTALIHFLRSLQTTYSGIRIHSAILRRYMIYAYGLDPFSFKSFMVEYRRLLDVVAHGGCCVRIAPLDDYVFKRALELLPTDPVGSRDRVTLLLLWTGSMSSLELCNVNLEDIDQAYRTKQGEAGYRFALRSRSAGRYVVVTRHSNNLFCPVTALNTYLTFRGNANGPLLLSARTQSERVNPNTIRAIIRKRLAPVGYPNIGVSSIKRGMLVTGLRRGVDDYSLMSHAGISFDTITKWKTWASTLDAIQL